MSPEWSGERQWLQKRRIAVAIGSGTESNLAACISQCPSLPERRSNSWTRFRCTDVEVDFSVVELGTNFAFIRELI
jgi:hypothetical protein